MMGKTLFAVVLVAASFAGGVFVNGPGLHWAKSWVQARIGHELWGGDDDSKPAEAVAPPVIKEPTVVAGDSKFVPAENSLRLPKAGPRDASEPTRRNIWNSTTLGRTSNVPSSRAAGAMNSPLALEPAPLEPLNPPSHLQSNRAGERSPLATGKPAASRRDPAVLTAALSTIPQASAAATPALPAAGAPSKISNPVAATATSAQFAGGSALDWSALRTRMKKLGVTRYGVDGTPGGQARFHCVVPLAGDGAVAQHFEAEADDACRAAEMTLNRIALWRATEAATR